MDKFNLNKCTESLAPGLRGKYAGPAVVPKVTIDELPFGCTCTPKHICAHCMAEAEAEEWLADEQHSFSD